MGGNASPELADLTLSVMEYRYLIAHPDLQTKLCGTMRYMDDLCCISSENFMEISKEIYDASLPLNRTNTPDNQADYLDININIINKNGKNHVDSAVYDKKIVFPFKPIRYVHSESNMSRKVAANNICGQIIRAARIANRLSSFTSASINISRALRQNGHSVPFITKHVLRALHKHHECFRKYGNHSKSHLMFLCTEIIKNSASPSGTF